MSGTVNNAQGFPLLNSPMVDPKTGVMTQPWTRFFISLWNRTGGGSGEIVVPEVDYTINDLLAADDQLPQLDLLADVMQATETDSASQADGVQWGEDYDSPDPGAPSLVVEEPQPPVDAVWPLALWNSDDSPLNTKAALVAPTVGASPYTFTAQERCLVLVVGGTMTSTTFSRDGTTFYGIGTGTRFVVLAAGDSLRLTYSAAPTVYVGSI